MNDCLLCLKHCIIRLRDLDTKKIRVEVFGELQNLVLEENGEDKMVREVTKEEVIEHIGESRTL
jgi:hypothetical protein